MRGVRNRAAAVRGPVPGVRGKFRITELGEGVKPMDDDDMRRAEKRAAEMAREAHERRERERIAREDAARRQGENNENE